MPILLCFAGILRGDGLNGVLNGGGKQLNYPW